MRRVRPPNQTAGLGPMGGEFVFSAAESTSADRLRGPHTPPHSPVCSEYGNMMAEFKFEPAETASPEPERAPSHGAAIIAILGESDKMGSPLMLQGARTFCRDHPKAGRSKQIVQKQRRSVPQDL